MTDDDVDPEDPRPEGHYPRFANNEVALRADELAQTISLGPAGDGEPGQDWALTCTPEHCDEDNHEKVLVRLRHGRPTFHRASSHTCPNSKKSRRAGDAQCAVNTLISVLISSLKIMVDYHTDEKITIDEARRWLLKTTAFSTVAGGALGDIPGDAVAAPSSSQSEAGSILYAEDFEDLPLGGAPAEWTVSDVNSPFEIYHVIDGGAAGSQHAFHMKTDPYEPNYAGHNEGWGSVAFTPNIDKPVSQIVWYWKKPHKYDPENYPALTSYGPNINLRNEQDKSFLSIALGEREGYLTGEEYPLGLQITDGDDNAYFHDVYEVDVFSKFVLRPDFETETFELLVDGASLGTFAFRQSATELSRIRLKVGGWGVTGNSTIDQLTVRGSAQEIDLTPLIQKKQERIDGIQATAGIILGKQEAATRVDQQAQAFLDQIDADQSSASTAELRQYREALHRMNAAEELTEAATVAPVAAGGLIERTTNNLESAATTLATSLFERIGGSLLTQVFKGVLDQVVNITHGHVDAISGRGSLDSAVSSKIRDSVEQIQTEHYSVLDTLPGLEDVAESLADEGIKAAQAHIDTLGITDSLSESVTEFIEELREIPFEQLYYFPSDDGFIGLPVPGDIDIPDLDFRLDLPDEILPFGMDGVLSIPDQLVIDIDAPDLGLDEFIPVFDDINDVRKTADVGDSNIGGINTTIDDRMASLENQLGSLTEQDAKGRSEITTGMRSGIQDIALLSDQIMRGAEIIEEIFATLEEISSVSPMQRITGVVGAAVLSGRRINALDLVKIILSLASIGVILGAAQQLLDLLEIAIGLGSLNYMATAHHVGTGAIVNSDLGGVTLD